MLGSYYKTQTTQAIEGLGDVTRDMRLPEQSLYDILTGRTGLPAVPALGVFTPWGVQTGSVSWQDLRNPENDLLVMPLSDELLAAAQTMAFGAPVGWIAVLAPVPSTTEAAQRAFDDTPYGLDSAEGVYSQSDKSDPPLIKFLYWGKPREPEDGGGGRSNPSSIARALGGTLVFPIQIPRQNNRTHPKIAFGNALDLQMRTQGTQSVPVSAPPTRFTAPPAVAASSGLPWWALLGAGAVAAWGGVKLFKKVF
jgi:hypothetical protein